MSDRIFVSIRDPKTEKELNKSKEMKFLPIAKPQYIINNEIVYKYIKNLSPSQRLLYKDRVEFLKNSPQPEQRTEAWYSAREIRITASEAADCLRLTKEIIDPYKKLFNLSDKEFPELPNKCANKYNPGGINAYLKKKANSFYQRKNGIIQKYMSSPATRWGQKYEDAAIRQYTLLTQDTVHEFGLICHPNLPWLGASPDGITDKGVMIEIKCPKSREITGVTPFHYFVQCQIQLECCNMDMCHFLECEFTEYTEDSWTNREQYSFPKGILIEYQLTKETDTTDFDESQIDPVLSKFKYPPIKELNTNELIDWANETIEELDSEFSSNLLFARPIYYEISKYNIMSIPRLQDWFKITKPIFEGVSQQLAYLQQDQQHFIDFKRSLCDDECLL